MRKTRPDVISEELETSGDAESLLVQRAVQRAATSKSAAPSSSRHGEEEERPRSSKPHRNDDRGAVTSASSRHRHETDRAEARPERREREPRHERQRQPDPLDSPVVQDGVADGDEGEADDQSKLVGVPLEVQEAWICEDLMFVLQVSRRITSILKTETLTRKGIEGSLIRYDEGYDPLDEDQRLQGAKWRIDPSLGERATGRTTPRRRLIMPRPVALDTGGKAAASRDILHRC